MSILIGSCVAKFSTFVILPTPHTGFELSKKINEFLHDYVVEKKYFLSLWIMLLTMMFLVKTLKSTCSAKFLTL